MGERRWIIIGEDGRHVTLGRHTDPTDQEIARAAEVLRGTGQGGWLAVTEGDYYGPDRPLSVMMVRELASTTRTWDSALATFQDIRSSLISVRQELRGPG